MLRTILRKYGLLRTTLGLTVISVVLSVFITVCINSMMGNTEIGIGLPISMIVPAFITPIFSAQILRLALNLDRAEQRLQVLSTTDDLTQIYNRRYFIEYAERELDRARRYGEVFSIAILDFDNFKLINDTYGHMAGDRMLQEASKIIQKTIRSADVFARYGGDEFILLFPETNETQARECVERIFDEYASARMKIEDSAFELKISLGVATFEGQVADLDDLLKRADYALYQAKKRGGNMYLLADKTQHPEITGNNKP